MFQPDLYLNIPNIDLLSWTFSNLDYDQDKPIYIDAHQESNRISYRQAKSYVRKLIGGLQARGLRPGDSVCVHAFNNVYYSLVYLAIIGAGGRFVGANPAYTKFELSHLFSISNTKVVLAEPELLEKTLPAIKESKILQSNVLIFDAHGEVKPDEFESWKILLQHGERDWITFDNENQSKTTIAALMSTSGTTGLPKAATVSHHAQVAQNIIIDDSEGKPYDVIRLLCLPLFHAFAGPIAHVSPLREGRTAYIMKRFDLEHFVEYISRYKISEILVVPPIVMALLALPQSKLDSLSSLRCVLAAGAPLEGAVQLRLNEKLHPDARFTQIWGLTEIGWITGLRYPEKDAGTVGRLLPNTEARIIDHHGEELAGNDVRGEVLVRSPCLMTSYLGHPEATKKTIVDGWLHTGDIGYQTEGKWYIVDRAKEIIKVRGWQVSPTELEATLLKHATIIDAAVIGLCSPDGQEESPRAYIVLNRPFPTPATATSSNSSQQADVVTDMEIHEHMAAHLAKFKMLSGGIRRVEAIPRSAAGKVLKKVLREEAEREREREIDGNVDGVMVQNATEGNGGKMLEVRVSSEDGKEDGNGNGDGSGRRAVARSGREGAANENREGEGIEKPKEGGTPNDEKAGEEEAVGVEVAGNKKRKPDRLNGRADEVMKHSKKGKRDTNAVEADVESGGKNGMRTGRSNGVENA